ncbi:MAG: DNA cytosine methyltransferase [Verrucomicrobiales bacterium]
MPEPFTVVDLFSGAGGMSFGFHRHPSFKLIAAADAEIGKPSMGAGTLQCNSTYARNMGFAPTRVNLADLEPGRLREALGLSPTREVSVLSACPPCTGFSRANPVNHLRDDPRNNLVVRAADFARELGPDIVVMENARELLRGNFKDHFNHFRDSMESAGYAVSARNHVLTCFGIPQIRERAVVIAARKPFLLKTLDDLWEGFSVKESHLTVRAAFAAISDRASGVDDFPSISDPGVLARLRAVSRDGGSWLELVSHPDGEVLMTPAMKRLAARGKFGSHPDVYGRMSWDKPAPTIKRECAHIGNGRYAHPEEDRLCSVREMAMLQGFPNDFEFVGTSLANQYRHIGDAVPPLISHQLAHVCEWILTGRAKTPADTFLPGTHLKPSSLTRSRQEDLFQYA